MPANKQLKIRKYPNRRYYDATRSQHLTLEQIHELVRDGYEVEVTDSKTGDDITAKVLAQILLDLDPPKLAIFPAALLHRLIRANEQLIAEFTEKYFNQALTAFLEPQKRFDTFLHDAIHLGPAVPAAQWMRNFFRAAPGTPAGNAPSSPADTPDGHTDLQSQIEQLRSELAALKRRPRKR